MTSLAVQVLVEIQTLSQMTFCKSLLKTSQESLNGQRLITRRKQECLIFYEKAAVANLVHTRAASVKSYHKKNYWTAELPALNYPSLS